MRIEGNSRISSVSGRSATRSSSGTFQVGEGAQAPEARPAAATAPTTSIDALLALQAVEDPLLKRRKLVRRGNQLIDTLAIVGDGLIGRSIQLAWRRRHPEARVLAFDYVGALLASVLFPLALLPYLGLVRTSMLFGLLNAVVALACARVFRARLSRPRLVTAQALAVCLVLGVGLALGGRLERLAETELYDAPVIFAEKTAYQRLTITRSGDDVCTVSRRNEVARDGRPARALFVSSHVTRRKRTALAANISVVERRFSPGRSNAVPSLTSTVQRTRSPLPSRRNRLRNGAGMPSSVMPFSDGTTSWKSTSNPLVVLVGAIGRIEPSIGRCSPSGGGTNRNGTSTPACV